MFLLGPDRQESTILKITGKISLVIYSLVFWKIIEFLLAICKNKKQKSTIFQINKL